MRRAVGIVLATTAFTLVTGLLLGTGGDPSALSDAPGALARIGRESPLALAAMTLALGVGGWWATALAARGRRGGAIAAGATSTYAAAFLLLWIPNGSGALALVALLSIARAWIAMVAGALLPLLLATLVAKG